MDSAIASQERVSRWSRNAVTRRGLSRQVYPTERDIDIFHLLARFRYLPADYIHAFVGGNPKALTRRLNLLCRQPNLYLARPLQQRQNAWANQRPLIYELDERGSRVLRERGLSFLPKSYHRNFAHELMIAQITASLELGTRAASHIRLISWAEILAHDATPQAARESDSPASIPVSFVYDGKSHSLRLTADARPFGIERIIDGQRTYLFFPGIEADCGSEPIAASDLDRSSMTRKLRAYIAVAEQGIFRSHFGFPNFFAPIITTASARMNSIMQLLLKLTGGRGSKMFLFKTFPSFTSPERPKPGGQMLCEPWQRAGFEPFSLIE
jgi:Replication-relaxation